MAYPFIHINTDSIINSVFVNRIETDFIHWTENIGVSKDISEIISIAIFFTAILLIAVLAYFFTKTIVIKFISKLVNKSKTQLDDILLNKKILGRISHIIPAIIMYLLIGIVFEEYPKALNIVQSVVMIYLVLMIMLALDSLIESFHTLYNTLPVSKNKSIKSYIQVLKIFIYLMGVIIIISVVFDKEIGSIFAGLGALTAVLMLVFKDSILGLVGGIQLSNNDMVRVGDWIAMPDRNVDGDVIEISLNTVKVQNWDKTIATIPTYTLVSESFVNWRGMKESGGRRIKRSLLVDMKSIKFCSDEMIEKFKRIRYLKEYIETKTEELKQYNKENDIDNDVVVNGRRLTNIGTFRKYIEFYLKNHDDINLNLTFLIRQLQPNEKGLPIEIYVFTKTTNWNEYEEIQSNIFDHILAVVPEFNLNIFQNPTGSDFQSLIK